MVRLTQFICLLWLPLALACGRRGDPVREAAESFARRIVDELPELPELAAQPQSAHLRELRTLNPSGPLNAPGEMPLWAQAALFDVQLAGRPAQLQVTIERQGAQQMRVQSISLTDPHFMPPDDLLEAARRLLRNATPPALAKGPGPDHTMTSASLPRASRLAGSVLFVSYTDPSLPPQYAAQLVFEVALDDHQTSHAAALVPARIRNGIWQATHVEWISPAARASVESVTGFVRQP